MKLSVLAAVAVAVRVERLEILLRAAVEAVVAPKLDVSLMLLTWVQPKRLLLERPEQVVLAERTLTAATEALVATPSSAPSLLRLVGVRVVLGITIRLVVAAAGQSALAVRRPKESPHRAT